MAGSRKDFVYTDDTGDTFAINLDESNTEAVNGTTGTLTANSAPQNYVPRNVKVREVFYSNTQRTRTIRCVALTPAIYSALLTPPFADIPDPLDSTNAAGLFLSRANGERRRVPIARDTGLNDGDQP